MTAKILDAEGNWVDKVENTDFTVDRERGIVTFTTAPGESPVKGQDNVQITASKVREDYLDAINKCTIAAVYGVGGSTDRVFLSGNAAKPGIDWYSNFEDPAFFPDTSYTKLVPGRRRSDRLCRSEQHAGRLSSTEPATNEMWWCGAVLWMRTATPCSGSAIP